MEITVDSVSMTYMKNTPFERKALENINLTIPTGSITGIIGQTGSGKSTLAQVLAGLITPDKGIVQIGEYNWNKKKDRSKLRKQLGYIFQFPEQQLFAENVEKDIAFALQNFNFSVEETTKSVKNTMENFGLPYEEYKGKSPYQLSGGQMRKVAIAGVLVYKPNIIIFDEPTVGLDSTSKKNFINLILGLKREAKTIIIVSHSMDEVATLADKLVILNKGQIKMTGTPKKIFTQYDKLKHLNLDIPEISKLIIELNKKVNPAIPLFCFSINELEKHLLYRMRS